MTQIAKFYFPPHCMYFQQKRRIANSTLQKNLKQFSEELIETFNGLFFIGRTQFKLINYSLNFLIYLIFLNDLRQNFPVFGLKCLPHHI